MGAMLDARAAAGLDADRVCASEGDPAQTPHAQLAALMALTEFWPRVRRRGRFKSKPRLAGLLSTCRPAVLRLPPSLPRARTSPCPAYRPTAHTGYYRGRAMQSLLHRSFQVS